MQRTFAALLATSLAACLIGCTAEPQTAPVADLGQTTTPGVQLVSLNVPNMT